MKAFVLLATYVAFTHGRPEAGYSYHPPSPSTPSGSYGVPGGVVGSSHGAETLGGDSFGGINVAGLGGHGFGGSAVGGGFGISEGATFGSSASGASFGSIGSGAGFSTGGFGGDVGSVVQKHIYVHVPPPEPEEIHHHRHIAVSPPQKHYKIIFIKAPTPPTPTVPTIPLQAQNEEKTIVYVLVKKPDDTPEITIPTAVPTQPSKPEVYFIRYKTQKETSLGGAPGSVGGIIGGGAIDGAGLGAGSLGVGHGGGSISLSGASLGGTLDAGHGNAGFALSGGHGGSFSGSISSGSVSSSISSGSSGISTHYGPPGHGGPY